MRFRALLVSLLVLGLLAGPAAAQAPVTRIGEPDQGFTDFSVDVSQETFDAAGGGELGPEAVSSVFAVLGRDDVFADTLAAGPLNGGAPLLAVPGGEDGTLPEPVRDELVRTLPPGSTVYLAGGTDAVSLEIESVTAQLGFIPTRLAGEERTETSVRIAEETVRLVGAPEQIIVAQAGDWPEAIIGGAYAADGTHPLVLTDSEELSPATAGFLEAHPEAEVIVVGPESSISAEVARAAGADRRVGGESVAETAALFLELYPDDVTGASIIAGDDPLGWQPGSAAAAILQPILYCDADPAAPSQVTLDAIAGRSPLFVLGGTDRLSEEAVRACTAPGAAPTPPSPPLPTGIDVTRFSGAGRTETALEISRRTFGDGEASAVVLTRPDVFPDALAGTPLAVTQDAPLLLTDTDGLEPAVATEIERVLPPGGTVYLLGGTAALSQAVADDVAELGYRAERHGGANRFETAAIIASDGLDQPGTVILTDGGDFPDAVSAGAAAGAADGAVLLTGGETVPPETAAYLDANQGATLFAAGGPAARAVPEATGLVGANRTATSVVVAEQFFDDPTAVGIATGADFPDALAGGAAVARAGGPLLLSFGDQLDPDVARYVTVEAGSIREAFLFGGTDALSDAVEQALSDLLDG